MLSDDLAGQCSSVEKVAKYESRMRTYAQDVVMRSAIGGKYLFGMRPFEEEL